MKERSFAQAFGRRLVELRGERTQGEIARAAGVSDAALSNYEHGLSAVPLVRAVSIVEALKAGKREHRKVTLDGLVMQAVAEVRR